MERRKIICLTPVKNEAWILETFLQCTSVWADYIIIADQGSTDTSVEIAKKFEKVILIENKSGEYNEEARQKLLLEEARKIEGVNNIFLALDADEIITNFEDEPQWTELYTAKAGTGIFMPSLNVLPGMDTYYLMSDKILYGYIDNGKPHKGKLIHSYRVPFNEGDDELVLDNTPLLHFQYASTQRLLSKHRWYECLERIKFPEKSSIDIYRLYHHIDLPKTNIKDVNKNWLRSYEKKGIDIKKITDDGMHWWDKEVCILFDTYRPEKFKKQAIWYVDWNKLYQQHFPEKEVFIANPCSRLDTWVHRWLADSQANPFTVYNKVVNKFLRLINW